MGVGGEAAAELMDEDVQAVAVVRAVVMPEVEKERAELNEGSTADDEPA